MKIVLIQPPIRDFYTTSIRTQPLGLAYVSASLKSKGYDVELLDCRQGPKNSIPIPPELSYLSDFYPFDDQSPFKLYSGYYHFGMGWRQIKQQVEELNADVYGISSSFTPYHQEALEVARIVKAWDSRKVVIMGGAHVSCAPESSLESRSVDYIVMGEGEIRLPLLLAQIERGSLDGLDEIDGIGYRRDGKIRTTPLQSFVEDLDTLPFPARELLHPDRYRIWGIPSTMIITSRGCPHRCAYCSTQLFMGKAFRKRSPERILEEMVECNQKYGTRCFDIEDDNFTFDRDRAKRLMTLIIQAFGEETLELTAMNGVSFASLDRELLHLMRKAGFNAVNLSLVSTDRATKETMERPEAEKEFGELLEEVRSAGLHAIAYAILGMPAQTLEEMVDTIIYLMGKRVLIGPSIYYPTPGTPVFAACKAENVLPPHPSQWRSSAFPIETRRFDRLDLVTIFRLTRAINFIKGKIDRKELEEGLTWKGLHLGLNDLKRDLGPKRWGELLWLVFEERSFFGLKKGSGEEGVLFKERSSKKLLDCFFEKAWNEPIFGSR